MAFDSTSKAIATEAWSELVHSVLSWTPPPDMSMEYYYTLPEDNSNRLDAYKYKLGTENIEARIKSGVYSQVVQTNEHEYHQGIEYIQDRMRSTNAYYAVKANKNENQQGIEYVQDCLRSTNDYYVVQANEGENQKGIEDIQPCIRSTNHYDMVQADERGDQQVIEGARHSIGSTVLFKPIPPNTENHQSINNIREFVRSQGLPKGLLKPEPKDHQQRINYEQVKKMSTLFDDLFKFIENYNMNRVEKPILRFQVLEVIKLLHHYGIDTIRSGVEEELQHVNQRIDATKKDSAVYYKKKALEVMLRICDSETCQSTIFGIIDKAERDQVLYEW